MRALLICLIAGLISSACATGTDPHDEYTLYLVRHAEKVADNSRDPDLTAAGEERALRIAAELENKDIRDIWSSDYQRTLDTAAPLAKDLGLEVEIYNPKEQEKLVVQLKKRHNNALIVGHSNTIPELARLLCACEVADMEETEYDRLMVVSINNGKVVLQTLKQ